MGEVIAKKMGITDMPCTSETEDLLGISKYVKGLETFIRECQTPMSIAIQGDWGTGKTSMLNLLKKNLEADSDTNGIRCVFFNTWQYSQFSMEDSLYVSFVHNLVKQCGENEPLAREILQKFWSFGKHAALGVVDRALGTNSSEIMASFEKDRMEQMESVSKLQENFAELVKKTGKRLVIFIDDLDRLNPEVAVELLEVIKLFVNVENSIFVLAIDYEVVVNGVRKKYGESLSEEKCRNFFDKIIQLPFKMPVERYDLTDLVSEVVQDNVSEESVRIIADFVSDVMGTNPRTLKRLVNAYFLIKSVNEAEEKPDLKSEEMQVVLMFCSLCIQMCLPKLYRLMITAPTKEQLMEFLKLKTVEEIRDYEKKHTVDLDVSDKDLNEISRGGRLFYEEVFEPLAVKSGDNKAWETLFQLLAMTSITMISADVAENAGRKAATKITHICINGKQSPAANANAAIVDTFKALLGNNLSFIEEFMLQNPKWLTKDGTKKESLFRQRKLIYEDGDEAVYLGVSSGTERKMEQVQKLCVFLREKGQQNQVKWLCENTELFSF